jgi:hypothetical protein
VADLGRSAHEHSNPAFDVWRYWTVFAVFSISMCWIALAGGLTSDEEDNTVFISPYGSIFVVGLIAAVLSCVAGIWAVRRKEKRRVLGVIAIYTSIPGCLAVLLFLYTTIFGPIQI